jgi:hypothetical protein
MEIHKKDTYDMDFLLSIISNELEESINIDFKAGEALSKNDAKKKEISKDVSAFANSNGGIIIYGMNEVNHKANSFSFIDGNEFTKEWLEQIISSTIQRNIPDLKIFPIRNNGKIEETVYVVQIPESIESPHICKDKKFYKRYNFESVAMEEYEVRNLYGKKAKSKLILSGYSISFKKINTYDNKILFDITTGLINDGDLEESNYKINVYFENFEIKYADFSWERRPDTKLHQHTVLDANRIKISTIGVHPIYPSEKIDLLRFTVSFDLAKFEEIQSTAKIIFKLLYSGGEDEMKTDFAINYNKLKESGDI